MNWKLIEKNNTKLVVEGDGKEAAYLDLSEDKEAIYLDYAFVHPEFRGSGVGQFLVKESINFLKNKNKKLVPVCGYVKALVKKNDLLKE